MLIVTSGIGGIASAAEDGRETGPLGTLVIEDPEGDTDTRSPHLDLREVWFDDGDTALTITLVLTDISTDQEDDEYEVRFLNDGDPGQTIGSNKDRLSCHVEVTETTDRGCTYSYVDRDGEREGHPIATAFDFDAETIQATIPYSLMGDPVDQALEDIRASTRLDLSPVGTNTLPVDTPAHAYVKGVGVNSDTASAEAPFLVAGEPAPGPELGTLLVDDPIGDQTVPITWYDLDKLWFASDGDALYVTFGLRDLGEDQFGTEYEVRFANDHTPLDGFLEDPSGSVDDPTATPDRDTLECDVDATPPASAGCHYHYRLPDGSIESTEVPMDVDYEEDRLTAQIPYEQLHATSGDALEDIEPTVWLDGENVVVSADTGNTTESYTLN